MQNTTVTLTAEQVTHLLIALEQRAREFRSHSAEAYLRHDFTDVDHYDDGVQEITDAIARLRAARARAA